MGQSQRRLGRNAATAGTRVRCGMGTLITRTDSSDNKAATRNYSDLRSLDVTAAVIEIYTEF